jgi:hypothetical protein
VKAENHQIFRNHFFLNYWRLSGLSLCHSPFNSVLSKLYTEPSIGASYQISVSEKKIYFRNQQELPVVIIFVNGSGQNEDLP